MSATEDRSQMWAKFSAPDTNTKEDTKEPSKPSTEPSKPTTTDYTKNVKDTELIFQNTTVQTLIYQNMTL